MPRTQLAALGLAGLSGLALALPTAPAQAAGSTTVTTPSCGVVAAANGTGGPVLLEVEFGGTTIMEAAERGSWDGLPGGSYVWRTSNPDTGAYLSRGKVTVKPCTSGDVRPVEGDENGDERADVLGVRRDDAKLYYYDLTADGLPDMVARRKDDGHLYRYANTASGSTRVWSTAVRIGTNWNVVRLFA